MKQQSKSIYFIYLVSIFSLLSCKKFIEIGPPKNTLVTETVFADSIGATAAVKGIYININSTSANLTATNGRLTVSFGLSADELYPTSNSSGFVEEGQFYRNSLISTNSFIGSIWAQSYTYLYQANACIEGISSSNGLSAAYKNQLLGESKFLRAFLLFNLVNTYGAVPLIKTTTPYYDNASEPRTDVQSIYTFIESELLEAKNLLSANYPSTGRVRVNKYVVTALLSRLHLYLKKWDMAEQESSEVITSGLYVLESNLNNVFLKASNEAIWQSIPMQTGYETAEGFAFIPSNAQVIPKYVLNPLLLSSFEAGDQRKISWVNKNVVSGQTYYYPFKYKLGKDNNSNNPLEYYMVLRLAEQYLIRAEARAQLQNLTGSQDDLNKIRARSGLTNTTAMTKNDLLTAIAHENQIEFFCECGHRWTDLKRTGSLDNVMSIVTPIKGGTWSPNWALYPIPNSQISLNPSLVQNPGY